MMNRRPIVVIVDSDAIIALAVAEEHKADAIFSFDNFYKKRGFKLASELK